MELATFHRHHSSVLFFSTLIISVIFITGQQMGAQAAPVAGPTLATAQSDPDSQGWVHDIAEALFSRIRSRDQQPSVSTSFSPAAAQQESTGTEQQSSSSTLATMLDTTTKQEGLSPQPSINLSTNKPAEDRGSLIEKLAAGGEALSKDPQPASPLQQATPEAQVTQQQATPEAQVTQQQATPEAQVTQQQPAGQQDQQQTVPRNKRQCPNCGRFVFWG